MSILHIVRTSAFKDNALQQCIHLLGEDDKLLLIDDGVYNTNHPLLNSLDNLKLALTEHCQARNIMLNGNVTGISMADFVVATDEAEKVITWQ